MNITYFSIKQKTINKQTKSLAWHPSLCMTSFFNTPLPPASHRIKLPSVTQSTTIFFFSESLYNVLFARTSLSFGHSLTRLGVSSGVILPEYLTSMENIFLHSPTFWAIQHSRCSLTCRTQSQQPPHLALIVRYSSGSLEG